MKWQLNMLTGKRNYDFMARMTQMMTTTGTTKTSTRITTGAGIYRCGKGTEI